MFPENDTEVVKGAGNPASSGVGSMFTVEKRRLDLLSSEDAGHRDWRNVRKNHLQNTAKKPEKPRTTKEKIDG